MATPNTTIPPAHAEMLPDTATVAGRVEMSQHELAREMKRDRDLLITKARFLARVLNETSDRLATNSDYIPLSHGIIQGSGADIDRLCALICANREVTTRLGWIATGEAK